MMYLLQIYFDFLLFEHRCTKNQVLTDEHNMAYFQSRHIFKNFFERKNLDLVARLCGTLLKQRRQQVGLPCLHEFHSFRDINIVIFNRATFFKNFFERKNLDLVARLCGNFAKKQNHSTSLRFSLSPRISFVPRT